MTNTQQRLTAIYATADRAGLPVEVKRALWQQLQLVGHSPAGRDQLLTRWEAAAETWPADPVAAQAREAMARAEYVI